MATIPVVDFQDVSSGEELAAHPVVQELHTAFSTVGFVYLTNHGIERNLIHKAFDVGAQFFALPQSDKSRYAWQMHSNTGYVGVERESVDPSNPGDLKEHYDICGYKSCINFPDEVPSFKSTVTELYEQCIELSMKILEAMGYGLKLQDPQYFVKRHVKLREGTDHNFTAMRILYYPPLPPTSEIKPGQLRCGEHVDYGSITLLFQDPTGGLQVKRSDGGYIDAPYIEDAVLVNLGALMQNWTADQYLATPHRVLIPEEELKKRAVRQSLAFFVHPDNEVMVECVDGSSKYPPITAAEDTKRRLDRILV